MDKTVKRILRTLLCLVLCTAFVLASPLDANAKVKKNTKKAGAVSKNKVIVLDPGHDTTHLGCHYEGFEEGFANLAIALYCKQELERYKGVTVYLTRTTLECPYGANPDSTAACLSGRVNYAIALKANAIVSLHNDYDPDLDTTQCGSKIIVPNRFYRPDVCLTGTGLARAILPQLTATGLTVNNWKECPNGTGIVTRNSGSATYPDGTPKDYYALINKAKSAGIPAIIVEHAYCTNESDRTGHLSTQDQLMQLGIADARGIAAYYGLTLK